MPTAMRSLLRSSKPSHDANSIGHRGTHCGFHLGPGLAAPTARCIGVRRLGKAPTLYDVRRSSRVSELTHTEEKLSTASSYPTLGRSRALWRATFAPCRLGTARRVHFGPVEVQRGTTRRSGAGSGSYPRCPGCTLHFHGLHTSPMAWLPLECTMLGWCRPSWPAWLGEACPAPLRCWCWAYGGPTEAGDV
jgi:hypothetical protein